MSAIPMPRIHSASLPVLDASRAVGVATSLLSTELKADFVKARKQEYEEVRVRHANRKPRGERMTYTDAVGHGFAFDWDGYLEDYGPVGVTYYHEDLEGPTWEKWYYPVPRDWYDYDPNLEYWNTPPRFDPWYGGGGRR